MHLIDQYIPNIVIKSASNLIGKLHQLTAYLTNKEKGVDHFESTLQKPKHHPKGKIKFRSILSELENIRSDLSYMDKKLEVIEDLTSSISLGLNVDRVIQNALRKIVEVMDADAGNLFLLEEDNRIFVLKSIYGFVSNEFIRATNRREKWTSPMRYVVQSGKAFTLRDVRKATELPSNVVNQLTEEGFIAWACAPLKVEGNVIGAFTLVKRNDTPFLRRDLRLMEVVGNIIGLSIYNVQLLDMVRSKENELRRALQLAVASQEDERKRISRELHDEAGQVITSILLRLKALREENDPKEVLKCIDEIRQLTSQTIEELRRMSMDLRPSVLDNLGIVPAIEWYAKRSEKLTSIPITVFCPSTIKRLSSEVELALYRICQEGITNATRHSGANNIEVILKRQGETIQLIITDDGVGFNPKSINMGLGLIGIRERVELLNGDFKIDNAPGTGVQVKVQIPISQNSYND